MSVEECPYCGKAFKRLKSHLPHCKMAPVAQPLKSTQTPQDLPKKNAVTLKQKIHKKTLSEKKDVVLDERQTSKNRRKDDKLIINKTAVYNLATTEVTSFDRPRSKWSAKRHKEHERLQQLPVSLKSNNSTSLPDHERDESFIHMSNGHEKGASQTNGKSTKAKKKLKVASLSEHLSITKSTTTEPAIEKSTSLPSDSNHENPTFTVMEEIKPNSKSSDINMVLRVKELKALSFFTSKTSVWDHIKGSLYNKRSCNLLFPGPFLGTQKSSAFELKDTSATVQQTNKLGTTKVSSSSIYFYEASIRRPLEDVHSPRLQSVRSLGWNPEIMTSFRFLFFTEPFRNSSDQFSGPSSYSKVPLIQQKLADVRLKELGVWLGAQSPKSPREIGTVLKQAWQWYYTRYIDVRRGGIGGISLLFASYCVLCYVWRYPHLKKERWRKYH